MAVQNKCHDENLKDLISQDETVSAKIQKCIDIIVGKEKFITYDVIKHDIEADGGNYLGGLVSVDIKGETPEGNKEIHIFFKLMKPEEQISIVSVQNVYLLELFVYKEVTKVFSEIQNEFNVPEDERYKLVRSFEELCSPDMIVLENMVKKGYSTLSRTDVVDLDYARIAVKTLAKFHGISFALQEKKPEYFNRKLKSLKYGHNFNEEWDSFIHALGQMIGSCVDGERKRRLEALIPNFMQKYRSYMDDDAKRCLCHCDYRPNNIMSKINEGKVTDLVPIDYQFLYYGCPILDFLYFMYVSTDRQFRRDHLEDLKSYYHESLETYLGYFNIDVNSVYSRKEFEIEFSEKLDFGLMSAIIVLPLILTNDNNGIDVSNPAKVGVKFHVTFKDRITGVLDEFIEYGLL